MAIPHAQPGEVIDVRPLGAGLATAKTSTLLKTEKVEVVRLVMAAGKMLNEHKAPGEITVHCLEGKIAFTALGQTHELLRGHLGPGGRRGTEGQQAGAKNKQVLNLHHSFSKPKRIRGVRDYDCACGPVIHFPPRTPGQGYSPVKDG